MKNTLLVTLSILISLLILEAGLRVFTPFPIHDPKANRVTDMVLGYRMSQNYKGIDKNGFRNSKSTFKADIAVLGDSHTFGYNVPESSSWPALVARKTGLPIYNYGVGGYGIAHYYYLFDRALMKKPDVILIGLYLANDLADYCNIVTVNNPDTYQYWHSVVDRHGLNSTICDAKPGDAASKKMSWKKRLSQSTAIGSMLRYLKNEILQVQPAGVEGLLISPGGHRTWLSNERFKNLAMQMDRDQPQIQEGDKAARMFLNQMIEKASDSGIQLGIVLIPSRERVMYANAKKSGLTNKLWEAVVIKEQALIGDYEEFFTKHRIPVVDAYPFVETAFMASVASDRRFYPFRDTHPLAPGYSAYSEAAIALGLFR